MKHMATFWSIKDKSENWHINPKCLDYSYYVTINTSNYHEEKKWDTKSSPTPSRSITLFIGDRSRNSFTSSPCYVTIIKFAYINSPCNLFGEPDCKPEINLI